MDVTSSTSAWHERLHSRFRGNAYPLLVVEGRITPAATLWTGSRLWVQAFRDAGLVAGDRILLALPPSAAFVQVLIACLWENLTVAFAPPSAEIASLLSELDASAAVSLTAGEGVFTPDENNHPPSHSPLLQETRFSPSPVARFLLRTSGTTGEAKWVALSDDNLLATLDSHLPLLELEEARTLSILPWHHAFGLIIDLLCALMSGAEIVRDVQNGRNSAAILEQMNSGETTHLCAVPLQIARLLETQGGRERLIALRGGVIGGATVNAELAEFLQQTCLRVGYGQTEASPGIALGNAGEWWAGYLGRPLGCQVSLDEESVLHFSGRNACLGYWSSAGLRIEDPQRWVGTGDIVRQEGDRLFYRGRSDDTFKLSNGRAILAGRWEAVLKDDVPEIEEALLHSPDGLHLELCVSTCKGEALPIGAIHSVFGSLGTRLSQVRSLDSNEWLRTPKGSIDRRTMTQKMAA